MWQIIVCLLWIFNTVEGGDRNWWKHIQLYELVIPSFKDSDGDGIGDLNGVISKLDYLEDIGMDSIWITPFFKSPLFDMGYDISNFIDIEPTFGTMDDFEKLMQEMDKRDMKLIIDFVINHSSDEHPWFQKSIDGVKPYDNYYIWKDPKGYENETAPIRPNNWKSSYASSPWTWNEKRKQFYFHQFTSKQPDLNLRNKHVKKEIKEIIKFWFSKGVSGLRMDAPLFYMEDRLFRDNPAPDGSSYMYNRSDTYKFIHELRTYVDEISEEVGGRERIMIAEAHTNLHDTKLMYGTEKYRMCHYPFAFMFRFVFWYLSAPTMQKSAKMWFDNLPKGAVSMWVAENHDSSRIGNTLVEENIDIINICMMMLPGATTIYYGQEIGMLDAPMRWEPMKDPLRHRDGFRSPMQWDNTWNAGFSTNTSTWLPLSSTYWYLNVENQKKQSRSHYHVFKDVSVLRKTATCERGSVEFYSLSTWILAFTRTLKNHETYVVLVNMGVQEETVRLYGQIPNLSSVLKVVASTTNSEHKKEDILTARSKFSHVFTMVPYSSVVLKSEL